MQVFRGSTIGVCGLLLGGIIIGALGILDDNTARRAAAVFARRNADPSLTWRDLYSGTMECYNNDVDPSQEGRV